MTAFCRLYNVTCLSMRRALERGIREGRVGFSMADVAADCLHPLHGRCALMQALCGALLGVVPS